MLPPAAPTAGPGRDVRRTRSAKTTHREVVVGQVLQLFGALMVLSAFTLSQFGLLDQRTYCYLLLNLVGSGLLAVLAAAERQWGFLLLEAVWAVVSLWGVWEKARGSSTTSA